MSEPHGFDWAIQKLKLGRRVCRAGWNSKGMWLSLCVPQYPKSLPYILMKTVQDEYVPWLASQTDMLADDWERGPA